MGRDLSGCTLGVIHVSAAAIPIGQRFVSEIMPEVRVLYMCDEALQHDNVKAGAGNVPTQSYRRIVAHAQALQSSGCDLVMVACSTMSRSVEYAQPLVDVPMLPIDRPMMERAVRAGRRVGLLTSVDTTVPHSTRLLHLAAQEAGRQVEVVPCHRPQAFARLLAGDQEGHDRMLLEAIGELARGVDAIAMAQISMARLEPRVASSPVPVFNSAREGFARARALLEQAGG